MAGPRRHLLEPARQVVWMPGGHGHPAQRAGCGRIGTRCSEVHELPLAGARRQHGGVAPAHTLDEHLLAAPDTSLVPGQGRAVDDRLESVEALGDDLGRDELVTPWPRPASRAEARR